MSNIRPQLSSELEPAVPPPPLPRGKEHLFCPHPELARLRAGKAVVKVACPTGITAWLVSRHSDVRRVLGDPRTFSNRPGQTAHVLQYQYMTRDVPPLEGDFTRMDGEEHIRFRRSLAPETAAPNRIDELRPLMQRTVNDVIDRLALMSPPIDLRASLAQPVTSAVLADMLGIPSANRELFHRLAQVLVDVNTEDADIVECMQPLFEYMFTLVLDRRATPGDDSLSRMIRRSDETDHPFTDMELVMMAISLLAGGHDTTVGAITYGFLALLENAAEFARLCEHPELSASAADEIVRFIGVGPGLLRVASRDAEVGGQSIAKGDYVVVAIHSANHDTSFWSKPDQLDIGRNTAGHLGYGHGPHRCVGQQLAHLELTTLLSAVAQRIPSMRLAVPLERIDFRVDSAVRGPTSLLVTWDAVLARPASADDNEARLQHATHLTDTDIVAACAADCEIT